MSSPGPPKNPVSDMNVLVSGLINDLDKVIKCKNSQNLLGK